MDEEVSTDKAVVIAEPKAALELGLDGEAVIFCFKEKMDLELNYVLKRIKALQEIVVNS